MKLKSVTLLAVAAVFALAITGCAQDSTNTTDENPAMQEQLLKGETASAATGAAKGNKSMGAMKGSASTNPTRTQGGLAAGKVVFTSNCASCHTLAAAGAKGTVGPNLDNLKPADALVVKQVTNGGGGMPAFKGTLSDAKIAAVAKYVSTVAGQK